MPGDASPDVPGAGSWRSPKQRSRKFPGSSLATLIGGANQLPKDFGVTPNLWPYGMRYGNVIGNVSGTPGFHTVYQSSAFDGCASNQCAIYDLGAVNPAATPPIPTDPLVASTMLRWANWDTVTSAAHFCGTSSDTGWSTTCASASEVPTGAPAYPNSVPTKGDTGAGQGPLPASLYYAAAPPWFGSVPWPPIGPDVENGDVGQCTGTPNTAGQYAGLPATSSAQCKGTSLASAWGGHVNAIPAMACYFSLGGAPDGTGGLLPFDAKTCYANAPPQGDGGAGADAGNTSPDGGSSGSGGDGGNGDTNGSGASPGSSGGCGCRAAPSDDRPAGLLWGIGIAGLAVARLRRRRR